MISNEEMYEFTSQIAGISDSDLQQYKCGGKAKKVKKAEEGNIASRLKKGYEKTMDKMSTLKSKVDSDVTSAESIAKLKEDKKRNPNKYDSRGNLKYNKKDDKSNNENWKPGK